MSWQSFPSYMYMSSLSKNTSPSLSVEPAENRKRPMGSAPMLIACRVCDEVFFNNVSLILHFESHVKQEVPMARLDLPFLQSGKALSLNMSPFSSSVEQMDVPLCEFIPRKNKCLRPLSVFSASTPNPAKPDGTLVDIPVLNSLSPINPYLDGRMYGRNLSKPLRHSTRNHNKATPSSSYPLIYSQACMRSFTPPRLAPMLLPSQYRGLNGGQWQPSGYKNTHLKQSVNTSPEIIVISDDEVDENKNAEIDLTLKL